jgi:hypothetical protein
MEITLETIISGLAWLFGGSGLGWFITWRWQKATAAAEVETASCVDVISRVQGLVPKGVQRGPQAIEGRLVPNAGQ